jgi:hypothetical protein
VPSTAPVASPVACGRAAVVQESIFHYLRGGGSDGGARLETKEREFNVWLSLCDQAS